MVGGSRVHNSCKGWISGSAHKVADAIIELSEDLIGFFVPVFELVEGTEHEIFLPQDFNDLVGNILAQHLDELINSSDVIINGGTGSPSLPRARPPDAGSSTRS